MLFSCDHDQKNDFGVHLQIIFIWITKKVNTDGMICFMHP